MEGLDIVRQAAEECELELEGEGQMETLDESAMKELLEPLPELYGGGEYPPPENVCPIHETPLDFRISEIKGWEYFVCVEEGCPVWLDAKECRELCEAWESQVCPEIKRGPYVCYCDRPYKWVMCRSSQKGNAGRLFLTCRDRKCKFFQWADTPPFRPKFRPRGREILARAHATPPRKHHIPERYARYPQSRESALTMWHRAKDEGERRRRQERPPLPEPKRRPMVTPSRRLTCDCYPGINGRDITPEERVREEKERIRRENYRKEEMYQAGMGERA